MENIILFGIIATIMILAFAYIVRAKRRGVKCVGCSSASACAKARNSCGSCHK